MPALSWDEGTAYDLFASLYVLHRPGAFGVRPSWAAGVRSRLPAPHREFLEKALSFLPVPIRWLYLLPAEAKTAAGALHALAQINPAERLPSLLFNAETPIEARTVLHQISVRQTWTSAEQEVLRTSLLRRGITPRPNTINNLCAAWSDLNEWGKQFLPALASYYQVFFAEEEKHIQPMLAAAREAGQATAQTMPIQQLLETISHGVRFDQADTADEIVLIPSYWSSPLVFFGNIQSENTQVTTCRFLMMFGARPESHGLVPGEALPLDLVETMKAIADPTRLRILRYLSESPQTPSQLARRLRLRPPTVIHHLNALRLVGLVEITLHAEGERGYSLRQGALDEAISDLIGFITTKPQ